MPDVWGRPVGAAQYAAGSADVWQVADSPDLWMCGKDESGPHGMFCSCSWRQRTIGRNGRRKVIPLQTVDLRIITPKQSTICSTSSATKKKTRTMSGRWGQGKTAAELQPVLHEGLFAFMKALDIAKTATGSTGGAFRKVIAILAALSLSDNLRGERLP